MGRRDELRVSIEELMQELGGKAGQSELKSCRGKGEETEQGQTGLGLLMGSEADGDVSRGQEYMRTDRIRLVWEALSFRPRYWTLGWK